MAFLHPLRPPVKPSSYLPAIPQPRSCDERYPSVLLDLGVGEKAEEIRITLNERELRIIELVAQGLKNSQIARAIGTSEFVVKNHIRAIYDELGLWNRVEIALWYEARRHRAE